MRRKELKKSAESKAARPRIIDLFAGIGGLSFGFESAGFETVLANEISKSIADSYEKNVPAVTMIQGDIAQLDIEEEFGPWQGVEVVVGGPPCQGFSQKGSRLSLKDERNYLFKKYYQVVKVIRPKVFVIENVPNILTSSDGFFAREINTIFTSLGYTVTQRVLRAEDYGVPQRRRRAIIIGTSNAKEMRIEEYKKPSTTAWDAISDLDFLESGEGDFCQDYAYTPQSSYQHRMRDRSHYLYNHVATTHSVEALRRLRQIPPEGGKEFLSPDQLTKSIYSGTWSRIIKSEPMVTVTTRFDTPSSGRFTHPYRDRAITVREAARIQSFPDDIVFHGTKSSQMLQVGNAVPPLLAEAIGSCIMDSVF